MMKMRCPDVSAAATIAEEMHGRLAGWWNAHYAIILA